MIPIPDDLLHLIEKRKAAADRRRTQRREEDIGPLGAVLSAETMDDVPEKERRGHERRYGNDRRGALG
jgi:hypothetical protein